MNGKPQAFNPQHPTVKAVDPHWHKIAALILHKQGLREITISGADIDAAVSNGGLNITVRETPSGLQLKLVNDEEAIRLAIEDGAFEKPPGS